MEIIKLNPGKGMSKKLLKQAYFEAIVKGERDFYADEQLLNSMFENSLDYHLEEGVIIEESEGYYITNYGKLNFFIR